MARRIKATKKALATIMAVSMIMSSVNLSAFAAENESAGSQEPTVTVVVTEVVDETTGDTTTTTVTEKTWGDETEQAAGEGSGTEQTEGDGTETEPAEGDGSGTEPVEGDGAETEPAEGGATGTEQEPVVPGTTTTTDQIVSGQEITTEVVVTDEQGRVTQESGQTVGHEETTDITETTTITVEKDKVVEENTDEETGDKLGDDAIVTEPVEGNPTYTEWTEEGTEPGTEWVKDESKSTDGQAEIIDSDPTTTKTTDAEINKDPLAEGDVTLNLKPNGKEVSTGKNSKYYVSIEELAADNIDLPENKTYTDDDGNQVVINVTPKYNSDNVVVGYTVETATTIVEESSKPDYEYEGDTIDQPSTVVEPIGYTEGFGEPVPIYDNEGNKIGESITETKAIKDGDGNIIGYELITTTTKTEVAETTETVADQDSENTTETFELPVKPEGSVVTDEATKITTTTTVEDIKDDHGNVIGYKTIVVKTDKAGTELERASSTIYGTKTTTKTTTDAENSKKVTTVTTETELVTTTTVKAEEETRVVEEKTDKTEIVETTVVTETETYQLVETEEGVYFIYKGQMWPVKAISNTQYQHGDVTTTSIKPNIDGLEPRNPDDYDGATTDAKNLRNPKDYDVNNTLSAGYDFKYVGYGLEAAIRVDYGSGTTLAHQFELVDAKGNKHYVLCADLGTTAVPGAMYNMENVETADYYKRDGAAEHINTIALNGYWGTTSGLGSLANVKALLKDQKQNGSKAIKDILKNLSNADIDALTDGQALAATQAAIWYYGNSDESNKMSKDQSVVDRVYGYDETLRGATAQEIENVNTLYKFLVSLEPDELKDPTTEFIDTDNFATNASIVIKEKVEDENGKVETDAKGNEIYNTDISFTIEMKPSAIEGNLFVTVKDEYGTTIATKRISGNGGNKAAQSTDAKGNAVYTLTNLQIAEGVKMNLNLYGTQNLDQGVYLYTAQVYSDSQTFVGISKGTREVNLSVDMKFEVEEPTAKLRETESSETTYEKDVTVSTKTDLRTDKRVKTTEATGSREEIDVTTNVKVVADVTVTEVKTSVTDSARDWSSQWSKTHTYRDDDDDNGGGGGGSNGGGSNGGGDEDPDVIYTRDDDDYDLQVLGATMEILDDDVPLGNMVLAVLPATGDISVIWVILTLLSGLGLAGMTIAEKKRKEN